MRTLKQESEILIEDLKKKLNGLECFRFLDSKQIRNLIKRNYKNIDKDVLSLTTSLIMLEFLDDEFYEDKPKKDKIDFNKLKRVE